MSYLVDVEYLHAQISLPNSNLLVIDCRFSLNDPSAGKSTYEKDHIPGAVFIDLEKDLSSPITQHGGRHPLPDFENLTNKLGQLGIDQQTEVIAYDNEGGPFAARLWWLLKRLGHEKVAIVDGGYSSWVKAEFPVTSETPQLKQRKYVPVNQSNWEFVTAEYVKSKLGNCDLQLIDSRERNRYLGLEEPIDKIAGHIPGAVNFFWKDVLTPDGFLKSTEELRTHFGSLDPNREVIVYCGSGVSACPNILALKQAGFEKVKLYAGSWSDWISYPDHPVAKGEK
jgi:thiosulfate/3-mercaptopyruvate sulfurtransferase